MTVIGIAPVSFFDCFTVPLPDVANLLSLILDDPGGIRYHLRGLPRQIHYEVFQNTTTVDHRRSNVLLNHLASSPSNQLRHDFIAFLRSEEHLKHLVKKRVELQEIGPASDAEWILLDDPDIEKEAAARRRKDWKDILKLLPNASKAPFDRGLFFLEGTRVHIFEEIERWLSNADSNVLWIYGPAGCGKSTIASELARRLETDGKGRFGGTFFCSRADQHTREPQMVFPTIAFQLANTRQIFMDRVAAVLRNDPHIGHQSVENQFTRLIRGPLAYMDRTDSQVMVIILDALDDCGDVDSREGFLQCLEREIKNPTLPKWFKLLITSRPEHDIRLSLRNAIHVPIKLDNDANRNDLRNFILNRMSDLVEKFHPDLPQEWPGSRQVDEIETRAQGLFLWVNYLYNFIKSGTDQEQRLNLVLSAEFNGGPNDRLYSLYTITLSHLCKDEPADFFENYRLYMGRILAAKTPLTSSALCSLIRGSKRAVLDGIVWRFGAVLYKDSRGAIRVIHPSLVEFLTSDRHTDSRIHIHLDVHNIAFALSCLNMLLQTLKFNMCELSNTYQLRNELRDLPLRLDTHVPELVRYSCEFWAAHLHTIPNSHRKVYRRVKAFFSQRVFYWLEVLSLLSELETALASLRQAQKWVKPEDDLQHMLDELQGFIIRFYPLIAESPPHIYLSALAFSQKEQEKRLQPFRNRLPGIPSITFSTDGAWGSFLDTAPGHDREITGLAFSADSRRLASCSEDMTVRVWDAETGEEVLGALRGHSGRLSWVAITPDASRLASVSNDLTARIWDGETGAPMFQPLEGHTKWVSTVAFAPCGTRIVTGSFDTTLRIWELDTGAVKVLEGHTAPINHVAFSSDGKRVVSGAFDKHVRVWNALKGTLVLGPLKGHSHWVRAVAFSPDNTRIASGSSDWTIRIWCAKKGTQLLLLQGHSQWVLSIAFSPDGRRLASGSYDTTVRVWDLEHGHDVLPKLEGHSASVKAVAFSQNGERILSAATDMTQQMWDANTGQLIPKVVKETTHIVCAAAISADERYMALGYSDGAVRIWNFVSAKKFVCASGPVSSITAISFSPAGEFLFYRCADQQVRVMALPHDLVTDERLFSALPEGHDISSLDHAVGPFRLDAASGWVLDVEDRRSLWIPIYHRDCILASSASGTIILRNKSGKITLVRGARSQDERAWSLMTEEMRKSDEYGGDLSDEDESDDEEAEGACLGGSVEAKSEGILVALGHFERNFLLRREAAMFLLLAVVLGLSSIIMR